jgi:hypothetical protein
VCLLRCRPPAPPNWFWWRRSNEKQEALRAQIAVPPGWSLESVMYELGDFNSDLAGHILVVHGAAVVGQFEYADEADGSTRGFIPIEGGALEVAPGMTVDLHTCTAFVDDDGEGVVALGAPGGFTGVSKLAAAGRLIGCRMWVPLSQRIHFRDSPVYADRQWHPRADRRQSVVRPNEPHTQADVDRAEWAQSLFDNIVALSTKDARERSELRARLHAANVELRRSQKYRRREVT